MTFEGIKQWTQYGYISVSKVLLIHYRDIGLTDHELVVLLQLQAATQHTQFPDLSEIAGVMQCDKEALFKVVHGLIHKQILTIKTTQNELGQSQDEIVFDLLHEKLWMYLKKQHVEHQLTENSIDIQELYQLFEKEFGRPLSPIELDTLNMWIDEDGYTPELIQMALKEAVLNQVYSLKYIDRILLYWEKKHITTKAQVLQESQKRRKAKRDSSVLNQSNYAQDTPNREVPLHDWLRDIRRD